MIVKKYKKFICAVLSLSILLSTMACGKKDIVVDEYGDTSYTQTASSDSDKNATDTDALLATHGSGKTLQEILGKKVEFTEDFAVNGAYLKSNASYQVPDIPYLNVYNMELLDDGKADEDKIVKAVFGGSAKKLEELSYTNSTDYITHMYKYKEIMNTHDNRTADEDYYYNQELFIIDSSFNEKLKWIDDKDIYIHMYEGDFNEMKYGLILAYDYITKQRYIFLDPVSVNTYFPSSDYRTLVFKDKMQYGGNDKDIENSCKMTRDEVVSKASDFLENHFNLGMDLNKISTDSETYISNRGMNISNYIFSGSAKDSEEMTQLLFTNEDIITAIRSYLMNGGGVGYQMLAEQENLYKEYLDEQASKSSETSYDKSLDRFIMEEGLDEEVDFEANGYAVYLGSCVSSEVDESGKSIYFVGSGDRPSRNNGVIKVTDKGIYGADIVLVETPVDVVEDVGIMSFDKIIECMKEQLPEKLDLNKMGNPAPSSLELMYMELLYMSYTGEETDDNAKEFTYIPVWFFLISPPGGVLSYTYVYVNAMDGELLEVETHSENS